MFSIQPMGLTGIEFFSFSLNIFVLEHHVTSLKS